MRTRHELVYLKGVKSMKDQLYTYQCPACRTLFTVHNPMRNDVLGQVVLKDIHCPNSECPSFVTLEPIRCNEPELELLREHAPNI